jgi:hypothetical protein
MPSGQMNATSWETRVAFTEDVSNELMAVLSLFQKDKSPGPESWTVEFCIGFFDLLEKVLAVRLKEVLFNVISPE